jgi:hypothetical protein
MGLLGKKELLAKQKLVIEKVDLGNDEYVFVKEMTGRQREMFERSSLKKVASQGKPSDYEVNLEDFRAKIVVMTACDEDGNLLLTSADAPTLSINMGAARLSTIADAAQKLNKITDEDKEDLVKNSDAAPDGSFNSGSAER